MPTHISLEDLRFSYVTYIDYLEHGPLEKVTDDVPLLKGFNGNFLCQGT